jgi:hypothetical protein
LRRLTPYFLYRTFTVDEFGSGEHNVLRVGSVDLIFRRVMGAGLSERREDRERRGAVRR